MTFKKGNGITAHFDFVHYYESIPDGVDFTVTDDGVGYKLVAFGYGLQGGPEGAYGNGALRVYHSDLSPEQEARFQYGMMGE